MLKFEVMSDKFDICKVRSQVTVYSQFYRSTCGQNCQCSRIAEFGFCPVLVFSTCILLCVATGFRHEVDEKGALLRHYATYSASYRRFGTTCRSRLQG